MRLSSKRTFFLLLLTFSFTLLYLVSVMHGSIRSMPLFFFYQETTNDFFIVDTDGCKIPKLDPFDPSIYWYLRKTGDLKCEEKEDLVYAKDNNLFINWHLVRNYLPALQYCKYDVIWRPPDEHTDHNFFTFINESEPFTTNITIANEFVRVQCYNKKHAVIYSNAFSFVHTKPSVEKRCTKTYYNTEPHLSIMMVGVDSVSRNNMIRYMPKTRDYLLNEMSAVEFLGYNKVADNTFLNIVPMTTGKFVQELPWNASLVNVTFDKFDFIWNTFSQRGYRTLCSEDSPYGQNFDYQKAGFSKPPADYFDRPFSLAMEQMKSVWNTDHHCVHARPETSIVLEYTRQFMDNFRSLPYFGFTFITRLTHDEVSNTGMSDTLYRKFLTHINNESILNNTILIFFSDHGIRFGKIRQTYVGKIEERLPFLFFVFPRWFENKYPHFYRNININKARLVTPFDMFETLNHFMNLHNFTNEQGRGQSILHEISSNRTCKDADILPHWCVCSEQKQLKTNDATVIDVANNLIIKLNGKLENYRQCEILSLKRVVSASKMVPLDRILKYEKSTYIAYQLMIQTSPGDGMFEGTVRYDESWKSINMVGELSRINMYGTTSHCVEGIELKKICNCKTQLG